MKTRFGLVMLMLGSSMLSSVALAQTQQTSEPQGRASMARTPAPSVPALPSVPAVPSIPSVDPFDDVIFPPDLIMRHARELGITDEQKAFMRGEIQRTTTRFNELQWQLQDAMEALTESMKSSSVNEQQALGQLDKVLDTEREIKRLHVGLGIRIKNQLTQEQQTKLHAMIRGAWREGQPRPTPTD